MSTRGKLPPIRAPRYVRDRTTGDWTGEQQHAPWNERRGEQRRRASALISDDAPSSQQTNEWGVDLKLPKMTNTAASISSLTAVVNEQSALSDRIPVKDTPDKPIFVPQRRTQKTGKRRSVDAPLTSPEFVQAQARFKSTLDDINDWQRLRARVAQGDEEALYMDLDAAPTPVQTKVVKKVRDKVQSPPRVRGSARQRALALQQRQRERRSRMALQVSSRLEELRRDSSAREEFSQHVHNVLLERKRHKEELYADLSERRQMPSSPSERDARLRERAGIWSTRRERAVRWKEQIQREIEDLQDAAISRACSPSSSKEAPPSMSEICRAWLSACAHGVRIAALIHGWEQNEALQRDLEKREREATETAAAIRLQRWWKLKKGQLDWRVKQKAKKIIRRWLIKYTLQLRDKRRPQYIVRIRNFLNTFQRAMRFPHSVRRLYEMTIRIQRFYRQGVVHIAARMQMLQLQIRRELADRMRKAEREAERHRSSYLTLIGSDVGGRKDKQAQIKACLAPTEVATLRGTPVQPEHEEAYKLLQAAETEVRRLQYVEPECLSEELRDEIRQSQTAHRKRLRQYQVELNDWRKLKCLRDKHFSPESIMGTGFHSIVQMARAAMQSSEPSRRSKSRSSRADGSASPGPQAMRDIAPPSKQTSSHALSVSPQRVGRRSHAQTTLTSPFSQGRRASTRTPRQRGETLRMNPQASPTSQSSPRQANPKPAASGKGWNKQGTLEHWMLALGAAANQGQSSGPGLAGVLTTEAIVNHRRPSQAAPPVPLYPMLLPPARLQAVIEQAAALWSPALGHNSMRQTRGRPDGSYNREALTLRTKKSMKHLKAL
eukprot:Hpha_TRINITY_DN1846_c0_g1::TRINITY_DN1846_c0_g1_i1::g.170519::m.170519